MPSPLHAGELSARTWYGQPGDQVRLKVWRQGRTRRAGDAGRGAPRAQAAAGDDGSAEGGKLGAARRCRQRAQRATSTTAMLVQGRAGAAQRAGLARGDVVIAINSQPVDSAEDIGALTSKPREALWCARRRAVVRAGAAADGQHWRMYWPGASSDHAMCPCGQHHRWRLDLAPEERLASHCCHTGHQAPSCRVADST